MTTAFRALALTVSLLVGSCGGTSVDAVIDAAASCLDDVECPIGTACVGGFCATPIDAGGPPSDGADALPEVVVSPTTLEFGSASLGVEVELSVEITNAGGGTLHVTRLEVLETDELDEYSIVPAGDVAIDLASGESAIVNVFLVQADGEEDFAELRIATSDADEPLVVVALVSELKGVPDLLVEPDTIDFGTVPWSDVVTRDVDVTNAGNGNAPLVVTAASITDDTGLGTAWSVELLLVDPATGSATPATLPAHLGAGAGGALLRARVTLDSGPLGGGALPVEFLLLETNDPDPAEAAARVPIIGVVLGCALPVAETCDGLDNDCDLEVDEDDASLGLSCVTSMPGSCAEGSFACSAGALVCVANAAAMPEACDAIDNDCDAEVDESLFQACSNTCGVGIEVCIVGSWLGCNAPLPIPEACDGLDNDCDGTTDELDPGGGAFCVTTELGACALGTLHCLAGAIACVRNAMPVPETCNALDDDCDGLTNEGDPGAGASCSTGQPGVCEPGLIHCVAGTLACVRIVEPSAETCNTLDDDCDAASADGAEDPMNGTACDGADTDLCAEGTRSCSLGSIVCSDATGSISDVCNGLDDDCDPASADGA
ncbi:MAG: hypothetical protein EXR73_11555, partial [Myxococcales bacterium]|nr:hypothetical protein [Myxococcales bacterium]